MSKLALHFHLEFSESSIAQSQAKELPFIPTRNVLEKAKITAAIERVSAIDAELHKEIVQLAEHFAYPGILSALQTNIKEVT